MVVIGFDADDVLLEWQNPFCLWHNYTFGTLLRYEDFFSYDYTKVLGIPKKEVIKRILAFQETEAFREVPSWKGAIPYINLLSKRHELHVVTSRGDNARDATLYQIEKYFPGNFREVHFTNHNNGRKRTKSSVCKENGIQIIVDDHFYFALETAHQGILACGAETSVE